MYEGPNRFKLNNSLCDLRRQAAMLSHAHLFSYSTSHEARRRMP